MKRRTRYNNYRRNISVNDIKYDLLKIIEPYDGIMEENNPKPVYDLFLSYLKDLKKRSIYNFSIDTSSRVNAITFDICVQRSAARAPKKFKIHVGKFQHPWIRK